MESEHLLEGKRVLNLTGRILLQYIDASEVIPELDQQPRCRAPDVSLFQGYLRERRRLYQHGVSQNAPPHGDLRRRRACRRGRRLLRPKTTHDNDQREGGSAADGPGEL